MYQTTYHRPATLDEAIKLGSNDEAKYLSGGQTLIPTMKQRLASPESLVDLSGLSELQGIRADGGSLSIGAGMTHADVASSAQVREMIPALADLAGGIGDPHVRNMGTLGGSVANNDPSADYPAAVLALNATIYTNKREISADSFFNGLFETVLEEGEIITRISFPVPSKANYQKFDSPASRYALVGVFAAQTDGNCRVAVTGAGNDGVFRMEAAESALSASWSADAVGESRPDPDDMIVDLHGTGEYRAHLVNVLAKRAVTAA